MIATDEELAQPAHDDLDGVPPPSLSGAPIGHNEAWDRLQGSYRNGRLPQGLMLAGHFGIGKATLAFQLARYLLLHPLRNEAPATGPDFAVPDSLFRQVASGAHPGIMHIRRPFNAKSKTFRTRITAEEVRSIGRFLGHTSGDGGYRIVIVDPAEDMNIHAANALLKVLEEPPKNTLFLLITHAPGRLLPTIRSRCQMMRLAPLGAEDMKTALVRLGVAEPPDGDYERICALAEGSVRRAILLLAFGGLDIAEAVDGILRHNAFDLQTAQAAAASVGGRGSNDAFDQFNRYVDDQLTQLAHTRALAGESANANRLSVYHGQFNEAVEAVRTYNLDRRHHVIKSLRDVHELIFRD
ncbi:DNA polymerase III subunit delta' [Notoacmeibacter sp. MSK16QG-6]|uniref:DNA polymerase III subunit delta' n=1 Tax=Notoacmeibacter sp. MSK16QG-6 TaxID=2957982 RepID=UPI00209F9087|nr:DNA polymerase III subunit delta' [Notoacmeibacter sp. MSK16QG-6]MCP1200746.1 DNA polymerase III subunit delta' [Notoacmeibacter sp. MSK16QG-6]